MWEEIGDSSSTLLSNGTFLMGSLDAQEVHLRNYAQSQNWNLIHIYCDAGISAKKDSRRPALEQLMEDAEAGKFDVVIQGRW